jgi:hypothetical protein
MYRIYVGIGTLANYGEEAYVLPSFVSNVDRFDFGGNLQTDRQKH